MHLHTLHIARIASTMVLLTLVLAGTVHAQEYLDTMGRWKLLNDRVRSGMESDLENAHAIFFRDAMNGFIVTTRAGAGRGHATTSDGGRTWRPLDYPVPVPHRILDDGFGIGANGSVSTDDGASWSQPWLDSFPNAVAADAASRQQIVLLDASPYAYTRLSFTLDGGATWVRADTVRGKFNSSYLTDTTAFGVLPPTQSSIRRAIRWEQIVDASDPRRVVAIVVLIGRIGGSNYEQRFIATLDLISRTASWQPVPREIEMPKAIDRDHYYAWVRRPLPLGRFRYDFYRSDDGGKRWDSISSNEWIDDYNTTFVSLQTGITSNGRSTDGGRTWTPLIDPFGVNPEKFFHPIEGAQYRFHALDERHWAVAAGNSFVGVTSDGGTTWIQSFSGADVRTVTAHRSNLLVGRDNRSILYSRDSGETFVDLGHERRVPERMTTVYGLAFVDTIATPHLVEGIASFTAPDGAVYAATIRSSDGGASWREGVRLPRLDSAIQVAERLRPTRAWAMTTLMDPIWEMYMSMHGVVHLSFVPNEGGTGSTGFIGGPKLLLATSDRGDSWQVRCDSIDFHGLAMENGTRGISISIMSVILPGSVHVTTDGGYSWEWTYTLQSPYHAPCLAQAVAPGTYCMLAPDMNRLEAEWTRMKSTDGGYTWTVFEEQQPATGLQIRWFSQGFWLDTSDIHFIQSPSEEMQHSTNGGAMFTKIHPFQSRFSINALGDTLDHSFIPPTMSGRDADYVYFAAAGNYLGRWRIGKRWRLPSHVAEATTGEEESAWLLPSILRPGESTTLQLRLRDPSRVDIVVTDLLGRRHATRSVDVDDGSIPLDLGDLSSGNYLVEVRAGTFRKTLSLRLVR